MHQVSISEAEHKLRELVKMAAVGDEIVITDQEDQPVARLIPFRPSGWKRKAGNAKGKIWMAEDFYAPLDDFREYME
jgi:antitoxin (DNA-binding transcriptional repressor) of toxin-antitoxin stability system